jgi:hypothetical protein
MPAQKLGPSREGPVVEGDQALTGDGERLRVGAGAGELLAQRQRSEDADDAGDDDRGLHDAERDVPERGARGVAAGEG